MVLFDVYRSFGVKVLIDIGWEIIENLDFQELFFFREKMKILCHITCTCLIITHMVTNTHDPVLVG